MKSRHRHHRLEPEIGALVTDGESEEAYRFLLERATEFVTSHPDGVQEDLLIGHIFGSSRSPGTWRPLFLGVMEHSTTLRKRFDGRWGFVKELPEKDGPLLVDRFVAIDVETTGLKPPGHRVIEIGLVRFVAGEQDAVFGSLCNPGQRVPAFITKLTGIRNEDVEDAPEFSHIAPEVIEFIGDDLLIGHNVGFDIRFINAELHRAGHPRLINDTLDTMLVAKRLIPGIRRLSLDKVATAVGLSSRDVHRAVGDADLTGRALVNLSKVASDQGMSSLKELRGGLLRNDQPKDGVGRADALMDRAMLADIPSSPGVYVMRDETGRVIYVGKSKNLRDRVRSYFSQPLGYTRKMDGLAESVRSIRCEETGTELEALLLEAQLIRRYQPRFNRALRSHEQYPYIKVDVVSAWPRVTMCANPKDDGALYFGPYRSRSSAKKAVELLTELYPLRTCPRSFRSAASYGNPCIRHDLHKCPGPCVGKADREAYREMVHEIVDFLEGNDHTLLERIHSSLEVAAEAQEFETARRLRNAIQTLEGISGEWRGLRGLASRGDFALALPVAHAGHCKVLLVANGRIWSEVAIEREEISAQTLRRLDLAWNRREMARIGPVDRHNVDEHAILYRWIDRNPGHPAIIPLAGEPSPDWLQVAKQASGLTSELFSEWQPEPVDTIPSDEETASTQIMNPLPTHQFAGEHENSAFGVVESS